MTVLTPITSPSTQAGINSSDPVPPSGRPIGCTCRSGAVTLSSATAAAMAAINSGHGVAARTAAASSMRITQACQR